MSKESESKTRVSLTSWQWLWLFTYCLGYGALRLNKQASVLHYRTDDRELWSNIDRIPRIGPALQAMYLPLIRVECAIRDLEWSP